MPKRILRGVVVSNKSDKTVTVLVTRSRKHPVLQKIVQDFKQFSSKLNIKDIQFIPISALEPLTINILLDRYFFIF